MGNPSKINLWLILYLTLLITGTLISITSTSWIIIWVGVEVNLIGIIGIITNYSEGFSSIKAIKYYVIQIVGSIIFILVGVFRYFKSVWEIVLVSVVIKMGVFPFWIWVPQVFINNNYFILYLLSTIQKIIPLCILYWFNWFYLVMIVRLFSIFIGSISIVGVYNVKLILSYSSISHSGWLIIISLISFYYVVLYLSIYIIILYNVLISIKYTFQINSIQMNSTNTSLHKIYYSIRLISLAGLPPFIGFILKLLIIIVILSIVPLLLGSIILFLPLIVYFYFQLFTLRFMYMKRIEWINIYSGVNTFILWGLFLLL